MTYYKVVKDNKIIDVLKSDEIHYLKYNKKHQRMFSADGKNDAQALFSSDKKYIWHVNTLRNIPVEGYDTVELVEIDQFSKGICFFILCDNKVDRGLTHECPATGLTRLCRHGVDCSSLGD